MTTGLLTSSLLDSIAELRRELADIREKRGGLQMQAIRRADRIVDRLESLVSQRMEWNG